MKIKTGISTYQRKYCLTSHERLLLSRAAFGACVQPHNPGWTSGVMSDASEKALVHAPQ